MEHGSCKHVKDTEVTVKTEVEVAVPSKEIDANYMNKEPGLGQSVKSKPASMVKEEIPEDCTRGTSEPAYAGSVNEACSKSLGDSLNVKDEASDMDIGPTMLQHMDTNYKINQNTSAVKEENRIADDCGAAIPCKRRKKESLEDKLRGTGEWRGVPATATRARGRTHVARDIVERQMKEEDADLDIGPTVLQHMDSHYRTDQMPNRQNLSKDFWSLESGEMPEELLDYLLESGSDCSKETSDSEGGDIGDTFDVDVDNLNIDETAQPPHTPSPHTPSPHPQSADPPPPVACQPDHPYMDEITGIITSSPSSPRPRTRDSEQWSGLVDEDAL